jgi:hypothetical protein
LRVRLLSERQSVSDNRKITTMDQLDLLYLALGVLTLITAFLIVKFFGATDKSGRQRIQSLFALYALIYGVMFVGGSGLAFIGYGIGFDEMARTTTPR